MSIRKLTLVITIVCIYFNLVYAGPWDEHGRLIVSDNGHYLQHEDGTPFLWIGDTGWGLFSMLDQNEVIQYLDNREKTGFNVIQAVAFWYPHGGNLQPGPHNPPNAYGHPPFTGGKDSPNTAQPLFDGNSNPDRPDDYWDHVDFIVREIKKRGMYLALLPCWGSAFIQARMPTAHVEFTADEARSYGKFIGERYAKEPNIIWVLGGDIDPMNHGIGDQRDIYRAMAEGIGRGVTGNEILRWDQAHPDWDKLIMTFHAVIQSSSAWFHNDPWLDVNMLETWAWTHQIYPMVAADYNKTDPVKPTIMGEGAYEYGKYLEECGWVTPRRIRQQGYHTFFAGATGHTYGAFPIWPMRGQECGVTWRTALEFPGAFQVASIMKEFLNEHEWWKWQPLNDAFIERGGEGERLKVACRGMDNELILYFPENDSARISLKGLNISDPVSAKWFNPENGREVKIQDIDMINDKTWFIPPKRWEDAVLIFY